MTRTMIVLILVGFALFLYCSKPATGEARPELKYDLIKAEDAAMTLGAPRQAVPCGDYIALYQAEGREKIAVFAFRVPGEKKTEQGSIVTVRVMYWITPLSELEVVSNGKSEHPAFVMSLFGPKKSGHIEMNSDEYTKSECLGVRA